MECRGWSCRGAMPDDGFVSGVVASVADQLVLADRVNKCDEAAAAGWTKPAPDEVPGTTRVVPPHHLEPAVETVPPALRTGGMLPTVHMRLPPQ